MPQIHTHYDHLKVARDAPPEVIRAAYKTLSQKYHPDRNPGDAGAAHRMALINAAYDVLSDPIRRQAHDFWVAQQEAVAQAAPRDRWEVRPPPRPTQTPSSVLVFSKRRRAPQTLLQDWCLYAGLALAVLLLWLNQRVAPAPGAGRFLEGYLPGSARYLRPPTAPDGRPWPSSPAYIGSDAQATAPGLSTLTVDNSRNDVDFHVKLVALEGAQARTVRQFYIPAFGRFTLEKIAPGSYDLRYRDLVSGSLTRSEAIQLQEVRSPGRVEYSNTTVTLYRVLNGNMQTYRLSEAEF